MSTPTDAPAEPGKREGFFSRTRRLRLGVLLLLLATTVGCDQTTKHFARTQLGAFGSVNIPGGFGELRLAENPGSFLSLGASLPQASRLVILTLGVGLGLLALLAYLAANSRLNWLSFVGLALVWAGGTSNLIDRVMRDGLVTDFVLLRVGPLQTGIFNAADTIILVGIGLLMWSLRKAPTPVSK